MSWNVNLIPEAQRVARRQRARRRIWLGVCGAATVLVGAGFLVQQMAGRALTRRAARLAAVEQQLLEVERRLTAAAVERGALLEQLEQVVVARRPQPWPARLARLAREAPPGVFLTGLVVTSPEDAGQSSRAAAAPGQVRTGTEGAPPPADEHLQHVRVLGYAVDHGALLQAVTILQGLPGWEQVELVRAAAEPFRTGTAVAFELACQTREDRF